MNKNGRYKWLIIPVVAFLMVTSFSWQTLSSTHIHMDIVKTSSNISDDDDLIKQMEERLKQIEEASQTPKVLCDDPNALNNGSTTESCIYPESEPEPEPEPKPILCNDKNALNYGSTTEECKYPPKVLCDDENALNYGSTTESCIYPEQEEPKECTSSIWIYNNSDEELTVMVSDQERLIQPGLYIEVKGECSSTYKVEAKKEYKVGSRECKVDFTKSDVFKQRQGEYEIVDINPTCVNTGKNYYEVGPLTAAQLATSGLEYSYNQEAYIYAIEISAYYNNMPVPNITFVATDEDGYIVKGADDKIASVQTNQLGKAYMFLYSGYKYNIKHQLNEDLDKYDARNGEIEYSFANATVRKTEGFSQNDIIDLAKLDFHMGLSDNELETQKKIENETNRILDWGARIKTDIEAIYNQIDMNKYNASQKRQLMEIKDAEESSLMAKVKDYVNKVEETVRDGRSVECTYDFDAYKEKINSIGTHWQHWIVLAIFVLTVFIQIFTPLHFIPLFISLLSAIVLRYDLCPYSMVFIVVSVVANIYFVIRSFIDEDQRQARRNLLWRFANMGRNSM